MFWTIIGWVVFCGNILSIGQALTTRLSTVTTRTRIYSITCSLVYMVVWLALGSLSPGWRLFTTWATSFGLGLVLYYGWVIRK